MASQEDDNNRECKAKVNSEQERNFINVYKKYDSALNSKTESLTEKIKALVCVWKSIPQCDLASAEVRYIIHIIDWAKLHTLNVVLTGEWKKYKDEYEGQLLSEVENTQTELIKINPAFGSRCQKLADVIKNPWSDARLEKLLRTPDAEVTRDDIEFFCQETAYLVSVRLKKLCESQCEDLALNLVSAYMKCYNLCEAENINLNATDTQIWFIFDIYVMLLHKFKKLSILLSLLKGITLEEGLDLIKRFYKKRVKISKVWKNSARVAHLASQVFVAQSAVKPIEESGEVLRNILDIWLEYNSDEKLFQTLRKDIRKIVVAAVSASHVYIFADAIHRKIGLRLKTFTIELFIRALTADMNDLEAHRNDKNEEKVKENTKRLAEGFCRLADVLEDNVKVSRECVLTAFSLEPSLERLKRIEDLAKKSGFEVLDTGQTWKCKLHPPALPTDDCTWKCNICGDFMCKPQMNVPLNTNIALHEALQAEQLGLDDQLCDDLVVLLSSPRYQILNWLVNWNDLHRLCVMYLNDQERTKNIVTELKFVDIDYSIFAGIKREPLDELAGIEKGYEQYLDQNYSDDELSTSSHDSLPQDSRLVLGSDGGETSTYFPLLPQKSDPNTLKSLRMFRPNLKRVRGAAESTDSNIPEKSLKMSNLLRETIISNPATTPFNLNPNTPQTTTCISGVYDSLMYNSNTSFGASPSQTNYLYNYNNRTQLPCTTTSSNSTENTNHIVPYNLSVGSTATNTNDMDPKNGLNATLPHPGGQVAENLNQLEKNQLHNPTAAISTSQSPQPLPHNQVSLDNIPTTIGSNLPTVVSSIQQQEKLMQTITPIYTNSTTSSYNSQQNQRCSLSNTQVTPLKEQEQATPHKEKQQVTPHKEKQQAPHKEKEQTIITHRQKESVTLHQKKRQATSCKATLEESLRLKQLNILEPIVKLQHLSLGFLNTLKNTPIPKALQESSRREKISLPITQPNLERQKLCPKNVSVFLEKVDLVKIQQEQAKQSCLSNISPNTVQKKLQSLLKLYPPFLSNTLGQLQEPKVHLIRMDLSKYNPNLAPVIPSTTENQNNQTTAPPTISEVDVPLILDELDVPPIINEVTEPPIINEESESQIINEVTEPLNMNVVTEPTIINTVTAPSIINKVTFAPPIINEVSEPLIINEVTELPIKIEVTEPLIMNEVTASPIINEVTEPPPIINKVTAPSIINEVTTTPPIVNEVTEPSVINEVTEPVIKIEVTEPPNINEVTASPIINVEITEPPITNEVTATPIINEVIEPPIINEVVTAPPIVNEVTEPPIISEVTAPAVISEVTEPSIKMEVTEPPIINEVSAPPIINEVIEPQIINDVTAPPIINEVTEPTIKIEVAEPPIINEVTEPLIINEVAAPQIINDVTAPPPIINEITQAQIKIEVTDPPIINEVTEPPIINEVTEPPVMNEVNVPPVMNEVTIPPVMNEVAEPLIVNEVTTPPIINEVIEPPVISEVTEPLIINEVNAPLIIKEVTAPTIINEVTAPLIINEVTEPPVINEVTAPPVISEATEPPIINEVSSPPFINEVTVSPIINDDTSPPTINEDDTVIIKMVENYEPMSSKVDIGDDIDKACSSTEQVTAKNVDANATFNCDNNNYCNINSNIDECKTNICLVGVTEEECVEETCTVLDEQKLLSPNENDNAVEEKIKSSPIKTDHIIKKLRKTVNIDLRREKHIKQKYLSKKLATNRRMIVRLHKARARMRKHKIKKSIVHKESAPSKSLPLPKNIIDEFKPAIFLDALIEVNNTVQDEVEITTSTEIDTNTISQPIDRISVSDAIENSLIDAVENTLTDLKGCMCSKCGPSDSLVKSCFKRKVYRRKSENNNNKKSRAPKRVQSYQLSPLQAINPRVKSCSVKTLLLKKPPEKSESNGCAEAVLFNVPGLKDTHMVQPHNVDHIVNVVQQLSGPRSNTAVTSQNNQTSTQVSPHIQRIGQPRIEKPEQLTNTEPVSTSTTVVTSINTTKPSTSQSSTLINILSQQIIKPGNQTNTVRARPSPLINILSQQIIKPSNTQTIAKVNTIQTSDSQVNSLPKTVTTSEQQPTSQGATVVSSVKNAATSLKSVVTTPTSGQGTILQLICKSTLPKFQQAFGRSVYQNTKETAEANSTSTETTTVTNVETLKRPQIKNSAVNIQPIQGGVIYTRQMPVGQTINLIPPGRGQVFRIANPDQISLVKDTVIHSKMSALLAAALQGKQKSSEVPGTEGEANSNDDSTPAPTRVAVRATPALLQNSRIVKPVLQIPSNVIRTSPQSQSNMSSTTLEQLREFDMVYKQIKERSSTSTIADSNFVSDSAETSTPQRIAVTYVNQGQKYTQLSPVVVVSSYCNLQPAASPALSVTSQGSSSPCVTPAPTPTLPKVTSKSSKGKTVKSTTTHTSKASPIPKPQQKPQEDEHTTQRIFDILAEYAEQLRNSPDLNNKPAPRRRSNPPTNPSQNSKRKKSSGSKKSGQCSNLASEADLEDPRTIGSEDSSCGVVQLSVPEDEQPQSQPATESNDSTSSPRQQLILTEATTNNQTRNLIIADTGVGETLKIPNTAVLVPGNYIMPVSMVKGGQQIAVVSGGSKILATVPARSGPNMLLFQSFLNQNRKTGVSTVKYSAIQQISGLSSQSITSVNAQSPVILPPNSQTLTAVTLGQPLTLKKVEDTDRVNPEQLLLTISQPRDTQTSIASDVVQQPDSSSSIITSNVELGRTIIHSDQVYQKSIINAPIATPVIAQTSCIKDEHSLKDEMAEKSSGSLIAINLNESKNKDDTLKTAERVQSVLVTACTSNGPMLSHTPPRYRKPSESIELNNDGSNKEEYLHNGEKQNNNEQKQFQTSAYYSKTKKAAPQRLERDLLQISLQRKAALERELRLQKSLSEECEDLGVDEPSTSDLFPEADLLFDSNHSPSFDQCSQDLVKRIPQEHKEEQKSSMTLFSDDEEENSDTLRTDFLFESVEYQGNEVDMEYDRRTQQITNGQSSTSAESGSSCEDNTLLQNCASMSDVTLNSPISCDYDSGALNKYKFKYSNRKKGERVKQSVQDNWPTEVSSSDDTTGSTELGKISIHHSHTASCDEELSQSSFKVVHVAITKNDEESCEGLCDENECVSGRGARRSVKKLCSCCNGQDEVSTRKRPSSRPQTPSLHKKPLLSKKR